MLTSRSVRRDITNKPNNFSRGEIRFPQASSYNRMLIHRTAAFFGMEHNVDTETQQCVIVAPTKNTRIPDVSFLTQGNQLHIRICNIFRRSVSKHWL